MKPLPDCSNLVDCACHWEKSAPDQDYLVQPMGGGDANIKTWTWREAVGEARRMANHLEGINLPPRSHIALCSKNCAYWIMADLAIWMAGHISVPIFPVLTADIVRYIIDHGEVKLIFIGKLDPVWKDMKKGVPDGLPRISFPLSPADTSGCETWADIIAGQSPIDKPAPCPDDQTATIVYTSGSTGTPKGVMLGFGAMYRSAKGVSDHLGFNSRDRALSYLPLAHVFERWLFESCSFYSGVQLFFVESIDTFMQDLQRARPTLFLSVPRLWIKFQQGVFQKLPSGKLDRMLKIPILKGIVKKKILKQLGLDQVRMAGSGSAPLSKEVIQWYRDLGLELLEGYGMTENFAYSHVSKPGQVRPGYVGATYPDVDHRISEDGQIEVKSPGNMQGYYKMPEENQWVFTEDGFIRTGDLGEIDEMGRLKITGRAKELFKTAKGKYVAPAPIENLLSSHPMVEACFVSGSGYALPHGVIMPFEDVRLAVTRGDRSSVEKEMANLLGTVNQKLLPFEKLAFLAVVNDVWLPENGFLTPTMKLKRRVLEETYGRMAEAWYAENNPVVWQASP
jgi:long-chain acyl-CoA synthetase